MIMKNRDWEERLQDGPYVVRPKHIQIKSIQDRVQTFEKKQIRFGLKRIIPITLFFAIIACVWIFNNPFPIHQVKVASTLSNNDVLRIIEQGETDPDMEMLYKEKVGNNGLLIFTKKIDTERQGMTWGVGYINELSHSWIRGGEAWFDFVSKTQYDLILKGGFKNLSPMYISAKEGTPFPILYGDLIDPKVSEIRISGDNHFQQNAKIINQVHGGHSLWFIFLPNSTNTPFKVEYMDSKGKVIEMYIANMEFNGTLIK
jgi:hypothetical protein